MDGKPTWSFISGGKGTAQVNTFFDKKSAEESREFYMSEKMYNGPVKITTYSDGRKYVRGVSKVRYNGPESQSAFRRKTTCYGYERRHQGSVIGHWPQSAIGDKVYGALVLRFLHAIN